MAPNKVYNSSKEAIADVADGSTIMFGGWGLVGNPENLIRALLEKGTKNLTTIGNNPGTTFGEVNRDVALLIEAKQVKKVIASYHGWSEHFIKQYLAREIEYEVVPQGTLAERIRAAGANIGGFYTTNGVDTLLAGGKEEKIINGQKYILELPLSADFAFIKAYMGDRWGNLVYRYEAQNFNPVMATAARITIAEVEKLVDIGDVDPNQVHTPGIYVDRIVKGEYYEKRL
jgi:3-oxoacid CoA-transferase A subunit